MTDRIKQELELLRRYFPQAEWSETGPNGWVLIPDFPISSGAYDKDKAKVCFEVPVGYPAQAPYAFYVEGGLHLKANSGNPASYNEPAATPFPGTWGKFSWQHDASWKPTTDLSSGSNLANFVLSIQGSACRRVITIRHGNNSFKRSNL